MKILLITLFSCFILYLYPQDSSKLNVLLASKKYEQSSPEEKIISLKKIQPIDNSKQTSLVFKHIGKNYHFLNKLDSANYFYLRSAEIAIQLKDDSLYSSLLYQLSIVNLNSGSHKEALNLAFEALELDKKTNDIESQAASLNAIALIYQRTGIYDKALNYQLESIKLSEKHHRPEHIANGYYNLGNIYKNYDKELKALEYFMLSMKAFKELAKKNPSTQTLSISLSESYYSLGEIYLGRMEFETAHEYFQQALEIKNKYKDLAGISNIYNRIGDAYFLQKEYDQALQIQFKALQLRQETNDSAGIALVYSNIGRIHYMRGDFSSSENFLKYSNQFSTQRGNLEVLLRNSDLLSDIYSSKGILNEALKQKDISASLKDSIESHKNRKAIEEMSIRFETDKKEQQNQILKLTVQKQKSVRNSLIATTVMVLLIVVILYRQFLAKKRTNKLISHKNTLLEDQNIKINHQKMEIEAKNIDLTDSIHYAKRIQQSLLSKTEELNQKLEDVFILFKPKDIVSGDFYWTGIKNNQFIFAAVDCTGHGVPGAFMSMLGDSYLNQIVYNHEITSPEKILQALDKNIRRALKQDETNNQDGMDMALCTIDLEAKIVEFAGAKNPLVYIKNDEVVKVRGGKQPIGGSIFSNSGFEKHTIEVDSSTYFYMFSDGYPDQFGGPDNKKFMAKRLQNLLLENHKKSMTEQKIILEKTINMWMQNHEQIDDILVVGFKLS